MHQESDQIPLSLHDMKPVYSNYFVERGTLKLKTAGLFKLYPGSAIHGTGNNHGL